MYRAINNLPEKDMAMLEERIKRQSKTRPPPASVAAPQPQMQQPSLPAAAGPNSRIGLPSANGQRPPGGIPSRLQRPRYDIFKKPVCAKFKKLV